MRIDEWFEARLFVRVGLPCSALFALHTQQKVHHEQEFDSFRAFISTAAHVGPSLRALTAGSLVCTTCSIIVQSASAACEQSLVQSTAHLGAADGSSPPQRLIVVLQQRRQRSTAAAQGEETSAAQSYRCDAFLRCSREDFVTVSSTQALKKRRRS